MSTASQIAANQENAQASTGPKTEEGKAASSKNNLRHGLVGHFTFLPIEDPTDFARVLTNLIAEHKAVTQTEMMLVERMAEHFWLSQRSMRFQDLCFSPDLTHPDPNLGLFLRYQTTHDRAFHKCLNDLLKLKAEARKAEKEQIGFERKKQQEANESRKQEMHEARLRALNSKTVDQEFDNEIRQSIEIPMPGHTRMPFDQVKSLFTSAIRQVAREFEAKQAA